MSYPEQQQPSQSGTQSNGTGSSSQTSPAMQRFLGQKPWEEPYYAGGSQSSSNNANGASTGAGTGK